MALAWVESVEVTGLVGRAKKHKLILNRDVNVIWGINGGGKTSLLKIIHSALHGDASTLVRVPVKTATVTFFEPRTQKRYTRTLETGTDAIERERYVRDLLTEVATIEEYERLRFEFLKEDTNSFRWRTHPRTDRRHISDGRFPHQYLPISRAPAGRYSGRTRLHGSQEKVDLLDETSYDRIFAAGIQDLWRDYSTEELANIRAIQTRGIAEILKRIVERETDIDSDPGEMPASEAFEYLKTFFGSQRLPLKDTSISKFFKDFSNNTVLRQAVTEIVAIQKSIEKAQEPARKVEALLLDFFHGTKEIDLTSTKLNVRSDSGTIPVASLSSGEKQIIRLLLECLAAGENCIIIDEPELSMHVSWQHRLISSLQLVNPKAQIIVATHSPEVMARLDDEKVFEL